MTSNDQKNQDLIDSIGTALAEIGVYTEKIEMNYITKVIQITATCESILPSDKDKPIICPGSDYEVSTRRNKMYALKKIYLNLENYPKDIDPDYLKSLSRKDKDILYRYVTEMEHFIAYEHEIRKSLELERLNTMENDLIFIRNTISDDIKRIMEVYDTSLEDTIDMLSSVRFPRLH